MEYKTTKKISNEIIKEILKVKKKNGLTAETIVNQARDKTNPLHELFEWDDKQASEMWRLQQARVLINEVKVIIEDKEYFAFENVSVEINETEPKREYFERSEILSNNDLRQQIVLSAFKSLLYWKEKYRQYNEFDSIVKDIERFAENKKLRAVA